MNEFKTFNDGVEISYSNLDRDKEGKEFVKVRVERWNYEYQRFEGLDMVIPSGEVENIDNVKRRDIDFYKSRVLEYAQDIINEARINAGMF